MLTNFHKFQEFVAMDLKFYNKHIILHMIGYATRPSASTIVQSKRPNDVIKGIFQHWISVDGTPEIFLTDNGGEFCNEDFINMCEGFNITIKTTGAESPWSNGVVERHNRTISEMLDKVIEDTKCEIIIALAWVINAQKSLHSVHRFSPYQLAIGTNPTLPNALNARPPAINYETSNKINGSKLN